MTLINGRSRDSDSPLSSALSQGEHAGRFFLSYYREVPALFYSGEECMMKIELSRGGCVILYIKHAEAERAVDALFGHG